MTAWLAVALVLFALASTAHAAQTRTTWDAGYMVAYLAFPASGNQTLAAVDMRNMLLYPPDDLPFLPAAFDPASIPSNSVLELINCTVLTTCSNFDMYVNYANQNPNLVNSTTASYIAINNNGGSLEASFTVMNFRRLLPNNLTVRVTNLLFTCNVITGSHVVPTATANSSSTLRSAVLALSLLGTDGLVSIQGTVSVSRSFGWPPFGYLWRAPGSNQGPPALVFDGTQPDPTQPSPSVLDLGMSSTVLQLGNQVPGSVTLQDLVLQNLCQESVAITSSISAYMSYMLPAFGGDTVQIQVNNTILLVSRPEVDTLAYWLLLGQSTFDEVRQLASDLQVSMVPAGDIGVEGQLALASFTTSRGTFSGVTFQADDLSDPPVPGADSTLQPTLCATRIDGSPVPAGQLPPFQPLLFVVSAASPLDAALQGIVSSQASASLLVLVQLVNASLPTNSNSIQQDLLWLGPAALSTMPTSSGGLVAALDLANRSAAIVLVGSSTLYMQHMTLVNPLEAALAGQAAAPLTAVPLWAFQFARNAGYKLVLADVQIVLPVASFAPLFALAWVGGVSNLTSARLSYSFWSALQHPILDGISVFDVALFNETGIQLFNYSGWGWIATNLLITPDAPFTDGDTIFLPSPPPPDQAPLPPPDNQAATLAIIIGVVLGVVGTLAAGAVVWLTIWLRRRKRYQAQAALNRGEKAAFASLHEVALGDNGKGPPDSGSADGGHGGHKPVVLAEDSGHSTLADADRPTNSSQHRSQDRSAAHTRSQPASQPQSQPHSLSQSQGQSHSASQVLLQTQQSGQGQSCSQPQSQSHVPAWDPMKEVEQLVGVVQGQQNETLQLLEPIGTGGFGTVYRGRWRNLDVAVKTVLFTNKQGNAEMVGPERRAIMEAAACSSVVHPNVVATYHYDIKMVNTISQEGALQIKEAAEHTSDWKLFLVQELCDVSLADAVEASVFHEATSRQPKLPLVFSVLEHIATGMAYIHSKNIIHGDLKPENVLLKHDPGTEYGVVAKITDFGLCSTIDPTKSHISGFNNGTPFYVAPEISLTGRAEKQSDVFSFGILLVEVYRGVPPWIKTPKGFRHNKDFLNFPAGTPKRFLALVKSCLDRKAKKRPQFSEICDELQVISQIVRDPPSASSSPSPSSPSAAPAPASPAAAPAVPAEAPPSTPTTPAAPFPVITHERLVSGRGSRQLASQQQTATPMTHPSGGTSESSEEDSVPVLSDESVGSSEASAGDNRV